MSVTRSKTRRAGSDELQERRISSAAPHGTHSPGWPHLDKQGNCLCSLGCCIGPGGCRCRECGHWSHRP